MERNMAQNLFKKPKEGDRNLSEGSSIGVKEREGLRRTPEKEATIFFSAGLRIYFFVDKN